MQALSAVGNITASTLSLGITPGLENFWGHYSGWQVIFFVSVFPVVLGVPIITLLKEPEAWRNAKAQAASGKGKTVGSMADLFRDPRWRHNTIVGICLGLAGMVGLWGIAFFSPELITTALKNRPLQAVEITKPAQLCAMLKAPTNAAVLLIKGQLTPAVAKQAEEGTASPEILTADFNRLIMGDSLYQAEAFNSIKLTKGALNQVKLAADKSQKNEIIFLNRQLVEQTFPDTISSLQKAIDRTRGVGTMLQDVGSLLGMFTFTYVASRFSRRKAFLIAFVLCLVVVSFVFTCLKTEQDVYWMLPMLGFVTLSVFAGYSIYFPEIFPTRLRGTGVGFCYNTVRFITAPFPFIFTALSGMFSFRSMAVVMASIYLVGMIALIWAPETKGQPLPED
jgi:MFS family permease